MLVQDGKVTNVNVMVKGNDQELVSLLLEGTHGFNSVDDWRPNGCFLLPSPPLSLSLAVQHRAGFSCEIINIIIVSRHSRSTRGVKHTTNEIPEEKV